MLNRSSPSWGTPACVIMVLEMSSSDLAENVLLRRSRIIDKRNPKRKRNLPLGFVLIIVRDTATRYCRYISRVQCLVPGRCRHRRRPRRENLHCKYMESGNRDSKLCRRSPELPNKRNSPSDIDIT
ncbi:hypothetical protein Trydic_g10310 [Trypoxylus dichotomus]